MSGGILGSLFDLNRDGQMSAAERAAEWMFLDHLDRESRENDGPEAGGTEEKSDWC